MDAMPGDGIVGQRCRRDEAEDERHYDDQIDYQLLAPVTQQLVASYSQLVLMGVPPHAIARAMLGAAINFHAAYGLSAELPALLRAAADHLEFRGTPS